MGLLSLTLGSLLAASAAPPGAAPATPETIAAQKDAEQRMTVAVDIGSNGPFRFLVDTGAQNTVLADSIASRLGLAMGATREVAGVAGELSVTTVSLSDIQVGRRSFAQPFVPLLHAASITADGILGLDGLQGQRVLLDFRHNLLTVSEAQDRPSTEGYDIVVTARRRMGQLIVTHARIGGVDTDVVIDTGSDTSIGNRALEQALFKQQASVPMRLVSVTGQEIDAQLYTTDALTVSNLNLAHVQIAFADTPAFAELRLDRRPALLLGMHELRAMKRVAIDFAHRKVMFDIGP